MLTAEVDHNTVNTVNKHFLGYIYIELIVLLQQYIHSLQKRW